MTVYRIDPLTDERWPEFLQRHPDASLFHTRGWLEALRQTYGYEPVVYTTCGPGEDLTNGIPFAKVSSWLTGRRLVSLPFSDHCQPLADDENTLARLLGYLAEEVRSRRLGYLELRPLALAFPESWDSCGFGPSEEYFFHHLDLTPDQDELMAHFHKTSVVQMIRRAEREKLVCTSGSSEELLLQFYHLLLATRRRHGVPPQPVSWFRNLLECLGDGARILVAKQGDTPVASIFISYFRDTCYYKYGCSAAQHSNLGGTPMLLWEAIRYAKERGAVRFDMGRSDVDNTGLVTFKGRWGSVQSNMRYYRHPVPDPHHARRGRGVQFAERLLAHCPDSLMVLAGRLLYKHVG